MQSQTPHLQNFLVFQSVQIFPGSKKFEINIWQYSYLLEKNTKIIWTVEATV